MTKWKRNKEKVKVEKKTFRKGKSNTELDEIDDEEEFIEEEILDSNLDDIDDDDEDYDDEEEDDDYDDIDDEETEEESETEEVNSHANKVDLDGSYIDDEYTSNVNLIGEDESDDKEYESEDEEEYKEEVFEQKQPVKRVVKEQIIRKQRKQIEPNVEEEKEVVVEKTTPKTEVKQKPKKIDKNLDEETNTFKEIPEKYLLRLTPRARAIVTHFSYLIKKNRRNDKNKKKSINDISKFSSLNEFFNTCIVAYGQSLIFDQQATLKKDDIVSVDDKLITLMNILTINSLKINLLVKNQKHQIEADYKDDFKETGGVLPITKDDFKELEQITQITKSLEINQNRWREEQSKESAEKDLKDLEETIRVVEIPIMEDKVDKQKKELIAARKEITRLKKQLGEK